MIEREIIAKQVLFPNKSPDRWFGINHQLNLYRGCTHGCIYCDSRSECYQNEPFETIKYKINAIELLSKELATKPKHQIIGFGSMSDPYNPLEHDLELTKKALEMIDFHHHGVVILTKSASVVRDIQLLKHIQTHSPVIVMMTITTANEIVQKKLEPHVSTTSERFRAIQKLTGEGIPCGVMMMPIIPYINDTVDNVVEIVRRAKDARASFVYPSFGMTLRDRQRDYFYQMIDREFPGLKNIYMDTYGERYSCQSSLAPDLKKAFVFECRKQKLMYGMNDIVSFIRPINTVQLKLF
jgi:DNA repair photolyase